MEDEILIRGLKRGLITAQERFFNDYKDKVFRGCKRYLTVEDAEDVAIITLCKAMQNIKKFRGESALSSWVYRIAYNQSMMTLRKRKQQIDRTDSIEDKHTENLSYEMTTDPLLRKKLNRSFAKLKQDHRAVFYLRQIEQCTNEEVSIALNVSIAATKSKYFRAREHFAKMAA